MPTSIVIHKTCGKESDLGPQIAAVHRKDPKFFHTMFCTTCRKHLPPVEFEFAPEPEASGEPQAEQPATETRAEAPTEEPAPSVEEGTTVADDSDGVPVDAQGKPATE